MRIPLASLMAFACLAAFAVQPPAPTVSWKNIDNDHYVCGRRCSAGYLKGKITLVCRDKALSARMEEIWVSFKTKPFVLVGSYDAAPKDVSYPVYKEVGLVEREIKEPIFIVDSTRRVRFRGQDEHRATESLVNLITDLEMPKTENQWRKFLDHEFAELPGRAYIRYEECKKSLPSVAQDYEDRFNALLGIPDIRRLVTLVRFARGVKDMRAIKPGKKAVLKGKIESALEKYASLKESENELVAQEAKNALADLTWAKAGL